MRKGYPILQSIAISIKSACYLIIYATYDYSQPSVDFGTLSDRVYYVGECGIFVLTSWLIYSLNNDYKYKRAWLIETIWDMLRLMVEVVAVTIGMAISMKYLMLLMYGLSIVGLLAVIFIDSFRRKKRRCPKH